MPPTKPPDAIAVNIPVRWKDVDPPTPHPANLFVVLARPEEVVLTFGYAAPLIAGTPEEQREQAEQLTATGMKPTLVSQFVVSPLVARQMVTALAQQLGGMEKNP